MEKFWLKNYQPGVAHEITLKPSDTINHLLTECCAENYAKIALENYSSKMSYGKLYALSQAFAAYCQQELGLKKGDRLAIMLPNVMQYPVVLFGALQAGLIIVNINPWYTADEIKHQLSDSGATAIVVLKNFTDNVKQVLAWTSLKYVITTNLGDMLSFPRSFIINFYVNRIKRLGKQAKLKSSLDLKTILKQGANKTLDTVEITGGDVALLQYTGGTTGTPKAAMLTHGNIMANIEQAYAWIKQELSGDNEIVITALPLYHIFSLTANCFVFLKVAARNILITDPRNIGDFIQILKKTPFTVITGVNTLFKALLNHPQFAKINFKHLKIAMSGGMPTQESVAERWLEVTGRPLVAAYGLTETSPAVAINPLHLTEFNNSIGLPISSTEIMIRDEDGQALPPGEPGELCVRGPQVMLGYWQQPEETRQVLDDAGWLRTGDRAIIDEQGFITIVDRIKDMILVSGFNVYPNEVEDVIHAYPQIDEVAVTGIPDEESGERVAAFIVTSNPMLTEQSIKQYCRQHLAAYKVPKVIRFVEVLPKSMVGKVLRRELREQLLSQVSQQ